MTGQCIAVGSLLLALGSLLLLGNVREAIAIRDARIAAEVQGPESRAAGVQANGVPANGTQMLGAGVSSPGPDMAIEPSGDGHGLGASPNPNEVDPAATPKVNQIPRVRVAAIVMPLGIGLLLLGAAVFTWLAKSAQPAIVAATLSGVAGILMLILGLEHAGSLLEWSLDPLGRSVAVLFVGGGLCLTLPIRLWLSPPESAVLPTQP